MNPESIGKSFFFIFLTVLVSTAASAQSGSGFAMIGIASGQSARVNALNMARPNPPNPASCGVTLQFLDAQGNLLKQTNIDLQPGAAATLDLSFNEAPGDGLRAQIRTVLLFGYSGGANPPPGLLQHTACSGLVPSLEVYDQDTGRTSLILTDAKALPPPAVPAQ